MAETPARKRAVSASRSVGAKPAPKRAAAPRGPRSVGATRAAAAVLEDDVPARNYALQLTEAIEDDDDVMVPPIRPPRGFRSAPAPVVDEEPTQDNFALRLTQALEAISAAQAEAPTGTDRSQGLLGVDRRDWRDSSRPEPGGDGQAAWVSTGMGTWLRALDKMPPIRLPIGPAIPWRVGLPALVALMAVMFVVGRPSDTARADAQGVKLPAQETYAVQQEAPLFAAPAAVSQGEAVPTPTTAQPIGVQEPAGAGFDFMDVGLKLAAVLGLAYGSLMLLKKTGMGGASAINGKAGQTQGMRVVSTLALAPNRSVHVIKAPGNRTLLVGATPTTVNLIADLGVLTEDETPEASSFLEALKGKLN